MIKVNKRCETLTTILEMSEIVMTVIKYLVFLEAVPPRRRFAFGSATTPHTVQVV